MAKALYVIRIQMFHSQFCLTAAKENRLKDIMIFSSLISLEVWMKAPKVFDAPANDLHLQIHPRIKEGP